jgi:hypothetical protein
VEVATTELTNTENPTGFEENKGIAKCGGTIFEKLPGRIS